MSAIGGICNFNDAPVDPQALSQIEVGLTRFGPDGVFSLTTGSVGMVYRAFHTNLESHFESQPLVVRTGEVLCWDGRLDNREDLISSLRLELTDERTDPAIVMCAYRRWGCNFLEKIIGDFALALWDPTISSLVLARDFVGSRTLYYYVDQTRVIWSTVLASLIDITRLSLEIDDDYVAGFVTKLPEPGLTPYRSLHAVPPGHAITIKDKTCSVKCFWRPDPTASVRYRSDGQYEEHFHQLFIESVACRLRADRPVWAELTGGMDSSPIVCVANKLLTDARVQAKRLETVSRVYDEASKSDERRYIRPVEERIGKIGLHLREDDYRLLAEWPKDYLPCVPSHVANFFAYYRALDKAMKLHGSRVLVTGFGGDELQLADGEPYSELVDLLCRGRFWSLHRRVHAWSASHSDPYLKFVWRNVLSPLLPSALQRSRQKIFTKLLEFYNPDFVKRLNLRDRLFGPYELFIGDSPGFTYRANYFLYTTRQLSAGFWQELCDIEFSYPFTHKPLVEFMLAIPAEQHTRPGESKSLVRRALKDLLPPELIERKESRITIWHAAKLAVAREAKRIRGLFTEADEIVDRYINRQAVLDSCNKSQPDVLLLPLIPFALWLESFATRKSGSQSSSFVGNGIAA